MGVMIKWISKIRLQEILKVLKDTDILEVRDSMRIDYLDEADLSNHFSKNEAKTIREIGCDLYHRKKISGAGPGKGKSIATHLLMQTGDFTYVPTHEQLNDKIKTISFCKSELLDYQPRIQPFMGINRFLGIDKDGKSIDTPVDEVYGVKKVKVGEDDITRPSKRSIKAVKKRSDMNQIQKTIKNYNTKTAKIFHEQEPIFELYRDMFKLKDRTFNIAINDLYPVFSTSSAHSVRNNKSKPRMHFFDEVSNKTFSSLELNTWSESMARATGYNIKSSNNQSNLPFNTIFPKINFSNSADANIKKTKANLARLFRRVQPLIDEMYELMEKRDANVITGNKNQLSLNSQHFIHYKNIKKLKWLVARPLASMNASAKVFTNGKGKRPTTLNISRLDELLRSLNNKYHVMQIQRLINLAEDLVKFLFSQGKRWMTIKKSENGAVLEAKVETPLEKIILEEYEKAEKAGRQLNDFRVLKSTFDEDRFKYFLESHMSRDVRNSMPKSELDVMHKDISMEKLEVGDLRQFNWGEKPSITKKNIGSKKFREGIVPLINELGKEMKVGVISPKTYIDGEWNNRRVKDLFSSNIIWKNFSTIQGTEEFREVDRLFVIGAPRTPHSTLIQEVKSKFDLPVSISTNIDKIDWTEILNVENNSQRGYSDPAESEYGWTWLTPSHYNLDFNPLQKMWDEIEKSILEAIWRVRYWEGVVVYRLGIAPKLNDKIIGDHCGDEDDLALDILDELCDNEIEKMEKIVNLTNTGNLPYQRWVGEKIKGDWKKALMNQRDWISVSEVAERSGMNKRTIKNYAKNDIFLRYKPGGGRGNYSKVKRLNIPRAPDLLENRLPPEALESKLLNDGKTSFPDIVQVDFSLMEKGGKYEKFPYNITI